MAFLPPRVSPVRAINDLRFFLAQRERHELIFAFLAVFLTVLLIAGFYVDSKMDKPYKRNIQYFENWRADRPDSEIIAKQKIDLAIKKQREAEFEKRKQAKMKEFQKVEKQLDALGL